MTRPEGASSRYDLDGQGLDVRVDVATAVFGPAERRLVRVLGAVALPLRVSGYAVAAGEPLSVTAGSRWMRASRPDRLSTLLALADGAAGDGGAQLDVTVDEQDTAFGPHVAVPWLRLAPSGDVEVRLAYLVALTGQPWDPAPLLASLAVTWLPDGARVDRGAEVRHLPRVPMPSRVTPASPCQCPSMVTATVPATWRGERRQPKGHRRCHAPTHPARGALV